MLSCKCCYFDIHIRCLTNSTLQMLPLPPSGHPGSLYDRRAIGTSPIPLTNLKLMRLIPLSRVGRLYITTERPSFTVTISKGLDFEA